MKKKSVPRKKTPGKKKARKKITVKRNNKGQFDKGECGNPAGKPPGSKSVNDTLRTMMDSSRIDIVLTTQNLQGEQSVRCLKINVADKQSMKQAVAAALICEAMGGNVRAAREIYDRIDGKPPISIAGALEKLEIIIDETDD